ncbi:MAG TPA: hypothetical protein VMT32_16725 [Bryobacteraceae bacterium]|nr:hypothetical protein [Bryobacteraceae bacterium]
MTLIGEVRVIVWAITLPWFCGPLLQVSWAQEQREPDGRAHTGAVEIQMRKVNFRLARDIVLEVRSLRGQLERTNPEVPVTFDDGASFFVQIDTAEVAITTASLTALMNSYVLAYDGAPIKKVTVSIDGDRLIQKGTIHKGVDLPFEIEGSLSTTADGNIRVHADKVKAAHVPVKGLLHLLGEDLSKLVNQNSARGMSIVGDDIILIPKTLTPPPHLEGRVTRVSIANGKIVQFFDSGRHAVALIPPFPSSAYIYHRSGILRFGKLTMDDADLEIVGDRPGVFEFFQHEYLKQLVAGYSKTTPANGLVAHMADYSRFRPHTAPPSRDRKPAMTGQGSH